MKNRFSLLQFLIFSYNFAVVVVDDVIFSSSCWDIIFAFCYDHILGWITFFSCVVFRLHTRTHVTYLTKGATATTRKKGIVCVCILYIVEHWIDGRCFEKITFGSHLSDFLHVFFVILFFSLLYYIVLLVHINMLLAFIVFICVCFFLLLNLCSVRCFLSNINILDTKQNCLNCCIICLIFLLYFIILNGSTQQTHFSYI